jgi:hypothetical protein
MGPKIRLWIGILALVNGGKEDDANGVRSDDNVRQLEDQWMGQKMTFTSDIVSEANRVKNSIQGNVNSATSSVDNAVASAAQDFNSKFSSYKSTLNTFKSSMDSWVSTADQTKNALSQDEGAIQGKLDGISNRITELDGSAASSMENANGVWDTEFGAFEPQARAAIKAVKESRDKFIEWALGRHEDMMKGATKDIQSMKDRMDRVKESILTDISTAKQKEKGKVDTSNEDAQEVQSEGEIMLEQVLQVEEKINSDVQAAGQRVNDLATARVQGISAVKNAMYVGSQAVVKSIHEAAQGDLGDVTTAWHEMVKAASGMSGDIEEALSEGSRLLNKAIDGQYTVMDADVTGLDKRLGGIDAQTSATKSAVDQAKTEFEYGSKEFEDTKEDIESTVEDALDTFHSTADADLEKMEVEGLAKLEAGMTQTEMSGYRKLSEAQQRIGKEMLDQKNQVEKVRNGMIESVSLGRTKTRAMKKSIQELEAEEDSVKSAERQAKSERRLASQEVSRKIGDVDAKLYKHLEETKDEVVGDLEPLEHEAKLIDKDAHRRMRGLEDTYETGVNGLTPVQNEFDDTMKDEDDKLDQDKKSLGKWIRTNLGETQQRVDKTGKMVNTMFPALKKFIQARGGSLVQYLEQVEAKLKKELMDSTALAGRAEIDAGSAMRTEALDVAKSLKDDMMAVGTQQTLDYDKWHKNLKAHSEKMVTKARGLRQQAQEAFDFTTSVHDEVQSNTHALISQARGMKSQTLTQIERHKELFEDALHRLQDDVHGELRKQTDKAKSTISSTRDTVKGDVEKELTSTMDNVKSDETKVTTLSKQLSTLYRDKTKAALDKVHELILHLKGIKTNQTAWVEDITDAVRGEAAQARKVVMLNAKSTLEQHAAVDEHFRTVKDAALKSSADLSDRTKDMMTEMVQTAKDTTDRILHDASLTKAEKEEQLMRVNAWLTTELKDITGSERELGAELDAVDGESKTFDREAQERANKLSALVDVKPDENEFNEAMKKDKVLGELIADAEQRVSNMGLKNAQRLAGMKMKHTTDENLLTKQVMGSLGALKTLLTGAESDVAGVFSELTAGEQARVQQAEAQSQDLKLFEKRAKDTAKGLSQRLAAQQADREHKLSFIADWQRGLHGRSAQTLERLMQVVNLVLKSSTDRFNVDKKESEDFEKKILDTVQSEGVQQLAAIANSDRIVDRVLKKDEELGNWTVEYDNKTTAWRKSVVESLSQLTADIDAELAKKEKEAASFDTDLYAMSHQQQLAEEARLKAEAEAEQRMADKSREAAAAQLAEVQQQFADDQAADLHKQKQLEFEVAGRLREAEEAEKDMLDQKAKLSEFVNSSSGVAHSAAKNILHVLDTKQKEVDTANAKVKTRIDHLNYIAAGVPPGTQSLIESNGTAALEVKGWAESQELLAEHRRLTARARELEEAADRKLGQALRTDA